MAETMNSVSLGCVNCGIRSRETGLSAKTRPICCVSSYSKSNIQSLGISPIQSKWQLKASSTRNISLQVRAAQTSFMPSSMRWWDKGVTSNMKQVHSAEELVGALLNAGDQLVVLNYFSPGCGACRSVHPKICQLAEANPDVQFIKVNYEENKSMCYSLHIHVLPFFQFYRGAHGKLCSFSCTIGTIKKFKDALAKHGTPRCSLGPALGFGEAELKALSENKSLSFSMPADSEKRETVFAVGSHRERAEAKTKDKFSPEQSPRGNEESALVGAGR